MKMRDKTTIVECKFKIYDYVIEAQIDRFDESPTFDPSLPCWFSEHYEIRGGSGIRKTNWGSGGPRRPHEIPDTKQEQIEMLYRGAKERVDSHVERYNFPIQEEMF